MTGPDRPASVIGVLLAAGRGRRLGGEKQLLPWPGRDGGRPLVAAAFDAVSTACNEMVVVVGHRADAVVAVLGDRRFRAVKADPDAPMFESIRVGVRAAWGFDRSAAVLLHPADHPEVRAATLRRLLDAGTGDPECAVMPEHGGRGGHPVLIPAGLLPRIEAWSGEGGLRRFWEEHPETCVRVRVDDPSVVRDVDTREEYGRGTWL